MMNDIVCKVRRKGNEVTLTWYTDVTLKQKLFDIEFATPAEFIAFATGISNTLREVLQYQENKK